MWTYAFPAFLAVAWIVVYFVWLRPWLKSYRYTMGIMDALESAEVSIWIKIGLYFQGIKTALTGFFLSLYAGMKYCVDQTLDLAGGITPSDLDPLKDHGLWGFVFDMNTATKIVGVLGLATTLWTVFGHKVAAQTVPKA